MTTSREPTSLRCAAAVAVAAVLFLGGPAVATAPQAVSGTYLEIESDSGGETQNIKLSLGPDRMRMDTEEVSLVSLGGDDGKMLMIQHAENMYMELTAEMMAGFAGMMGGQMPDVEEEVANATPPTFTRTGNTKQVGGWNAYEVIVEHPDQDGDMTMWFSPDVDADFRQVAQQVIGSVASLLNSPMLRMGGGGGGGGQDLMNSIQAQLSSVDMPDGFPVQIVSNSGGVQAVNTLRAIDQSVSFEPSTWEAPEGYEKMQLPFRR